MLTKLPVPYDPCVDGRYPKFTSSRFQLGEGFSVIVKLVTSLLVVADGLLDVGAAGVWDHAGHGVQRPQLGPHHRRLAAPRHLGVQVLAEGVGAAPRHHLPRTDSDREEGRYKSNPGVMGRLLMLLAVLV